MNPQLTESEARLIYLHLQKAMDMLGYCGLYDQATDVKNIINDVAIAAYERTSS